MAGHHGLELEVALAGERRGLGPHGEAVADRHEADRRPVDLVDQAHVGEDRRVAHMIDGLALVRGDDKPATGAEIDRAPVMEDAGGMPGRHEGDVEILVMEVPPVLPGSIVLHPEARHMHGELKHRDERRARLLADGHCVAGMVLMTMGECHMGDALGDAVHARPVFSKVGFPVRNGSIRMLDLAVSMRKQEWPNQVICMTCSELSTF